jgi:hypothetical protein
MTTRLASSASDAVSAIASGHRVYVHEAAMAPCSAIWAASGSTLRGEKAPCLRAIVFPGSASAQGARVSLPPALDRSRHATSDLQPFNVST